LVGGLAASEQRPAVAFQQLAGLYS
jgi:hypothetical protein